MDSGRKRMAAVCAFTVGAIVACASVDRAVDVRDVEIAEGVVFRLPEADALVETLDATQLLTGAYGSRSYTLQTQLEWRPGSVALAALNVWGTVVFSINYDGDVLQMRGSRRVMQGLPAEYVLADVLLTFMETVPPDRLRGEGVAILDAGRRRTISRHGMPIIVIEYAGDSRWEGEVRLEHLERDYALRIDTIEVVE